MLKNIFSTWNFNPSFRNLNLKCGKLEGYPKMRGTPKIQFKEAVGYETRDGMNIFDMGSYVEHFDVMVKKV